jgi:carbamoyltransferase
MKLLSLRLCDHDSNFSYFDGESVHYFKSERKYQIKKHSYNDMYLWKKEIKEVWDLESKELDEIAIVFDPWKHGLPTNNEVFFPAISYELFPFSKPVWRVNHHYAHALSSWMFKKNITKHIVIDGFGDLKNSWTVFLNENIVERGFLDQNGSVGISMANVGRKLGISAENELDIAGKLMGLQSFGNYDKGFARIIEEHSLYTINELFDFNEWINYKEDGLLAELTKLDWAKTVHNIVGLKILNLFQEFFSKNDVISYSGGVAQNVLWNTEIIKVFPNVVIPPHCADEGLSLGALEWLRIKNNLDNFTLKNFPFCQNDESTNEPSLKTIKRVANFLLQKKIVAWYQGNGEIGPRALGNRSILMDPRIENGKEKINMIKNRENYRPFGASVLQKYKNECFEDLIDNPYMLFVGKEKNNLFPSITHIDKTCRVQTVNEDNKNFFDLLTEFYNLSGCPVLLNTSLNMAGKPIAGSVKDCFEIFNNSKIDVLVIGDNIYEKV